MAYWKAVLDPDEYLAFLEWWDDPGDEHVAVVGLTVEVAGAGDTMAVMWEGAETALVSVLPPETEVVSIDWLEYAGGWKQKREVPGEC